MIAAREAMKDSGIGTPATRAAIIERLIDVGYIERDGRALHATEKGVQVIRLLGSHPLTSPQLTGDWERRLALIEGRPRLRLRDLEAEGRQEPPAERREGADGESPRVDRARRRPSRWTDGQAGAGIQGPLG